VTGVAEMNEPEKERILALIAEGVIRPEEAVSLLAALSDEPKPVAPSSANPVEKKPPATKTESKEPLMEVQMQRADGSTYTIQVPPNLVPLFWNIAKVAIKESARTAAQETWSGFKHIVRKKTREVGTNVKNRVTSIGSRPAVITAEIEEEEGVDKFEARRQILQMVQNGRISASDAGRLIEQLDALDLYVRARGGTGVKAAPPG
jgi:hypothetical protein